MPRRADVVLIEIEQAISGIADAVQDKSLSDFKTDWLLKHGVQRGLEIISEAVRHLPDDMLARRPGIPWPQIKALGNLFRHEYHRIEDEIVWTVVIDDLPALADAIRTFRTATTEDSR